MAITVAKLAGQKSLNTYDLFFCSVVGLSDYLVILKYL
jgi:hypothetical protein